MVGVNSCFYLEGEFTCRRKNIMKVKGAAIMINVILMFALVQVTCSLE